MKKLYIKTYGCQMNVYDSMKMGELLMPHGYMVCEDVTDADMVILNTCHIREKASEKTFCELGRIKKEKDRRKALGRDMTIVVAGCVAQAEGEEITKRAKYVDIVVGPQSYHNLPNLLEEVKRSRGIVIDLNFAQNEKFDKIANDVNMADNKQFSAFVSVQEGCDKFCHFCVVPYTRGAEFSRDANAVYREAIALASHGTKEINLLGQNVSAYHGLLDGSEIGLAALISRIAAIKGIERILYTTSHPNDMQDEALFKLYKEEQKLLPYLHLPVQSGSSAILSSMNRKHTREYYLSLIDKFRAARSDMAFSSDFIVGYPGETDKDFADTVDIVKRVGFAQCYSFKYSPRPGTPASVLKNQVPEDVKDERLAILQHAIREQQDSFNKATVGKVVSVLFDRNGIYDGQISGKSQYMQAVAVQADSALIGQIKSVRVTGMKKNSLIGELLDE